MKLRDLPLVLTLLVAMTSHISAADPRVSVGQLRCTVEPLPAGSKALKRDVSCVFKPLAGATASFAGTIKRTSGPALMDANIVFVWTVFAPEAEFAPQSLAGRYLSSLTDGNSLSAAKVGSLIGRSTIPVELRAVTSAATAGNAERTIVIELDLQATRA